MTAIALPAAAALNPSANGAGKAGAAAELAADGSFQQVLAQQAAKGNTEPSAQPAPAPAQKSTQQAVHDQSRQAKPGQSEKDGEAQEGQEVLAAEARSDATVLPWPLAGLLPLQEGKAAAELPAAQASAGLEPPALPAIPLAAHAGAAHAVAVGTLKPDAGRMADDRAPALRPDGPQTAAAAAQPATVLQPAVEADALSAESPGKTIAETTTPQPAFAGLLAAREAAAAPALMQTAQAAAGQHVIEPRLGTRGWDQTVAQKVVWMVGAAEQSATLTLNPPDLGPLQVVIQVSNDQASTTFVSDNPEVRQALQDSINTLRGMMGSAGIALGEANIQSGSQAQQQFQQAARQQMAGQAAGRNGSAEAVQGSPAATVHGGNGLVDTFA